MDDPRPWARGKTALELLTVGDQLVGALQQVAAQPQQVYQAPVAQAWGDAKDDDILTVGQARAMVGQMQTQQPSNVQQIAQMAYATVKAEPRGQDIFAKYEPEILRDLASLPASLWTLDNLRTVRDVVGSRHLDELADQRAQAKYANMQGLPTRGNGSGFDAAPVSDGLPANFQEILSKKGLDLGMVRGFCASNGWTVKQWFENEARMHAVGSA